MYYQFSPLCKSLNVWILCLDLSVTSESNLASLLIIILHTKHTSCELLRNVAATNNILSTHWTTTHTGLSSAEITDCMSITALPDPDQRTRWDSKCKIFFNLLLGWPHLLETNRTLQLRSSVGHSVSRVSRGGQNYLKILQWVFETVNINSHLSL